MGCSERRSLVLAYERSGYGCGPGANPAPVESNGSNGLPAATSGPLVLPAARDG